MPDVHLTDEQLTEFRDGVLSNPVVVSHLRSCTECQNRLREARLLHLLLARPEQRKSAHPTAEDLACYLEGGPIDMARKTLEAHVAGCPQCFADLDTIREQLQPGSSQADAPAEWVVAGAARNFRPPATPLSLGTLLVHWLNRIGPLLRLIPPPVANVAQESASPLAGSAASFLALPPTLPRIDDRAVGRGRDFEPADSDRAMAMREEREEPEPIDITIGQLKIHITTQGRTRNKVTMTVVVTRSSDNEPVPGVQLSLETTQQPAAAAITSDNGVAEFFLPQGLATLVVQSPIRAELQIFF